MRYQVLVSQIIFEVIPTTISPMDMNHILLVEVVDSWKPNCDINSTVTQMPCVQIHINSRDMRIHKV